MTSRGVRIEIATEFARLEQLAGQWDAIWSADRCRTIFGSFQWAKASWLSYGGGRSLCASLAFSGNELVGILPLVVEGKTIKFLGSPRSDYNDLVCGPSVGPDILEQLIRGVMRMPVTWRRGLLENLSSQSNLLARLRKIEGSLWSQMCISHQSYSPCVDLSHDRQGVLDRIRQKKSLRRHEKKLGALGQVGFRHIENKGEIRDHLPLFFQQHIARRAIAGSRSIFRELEARNFYERLVDQLDPRHELRFSVLEVGGNPVAYHFGFECNGVFFWYKPTFDVDLSDYSPGEVLMKHLFEYVANSQHIHKFDFTIGEETFKSRFANLSVETSIVHMYPCSLTGRSKTKAKKTINGLHQRMRKYPRALAYLKTIAVGQKSFSIRARTAISRHGVVGTGLRLIRLAWRRAIFARDEVLVFTRGDAPAVDQSGTLEIRAGKLADLALLAAKHSEYLTAAKLKKASERLKAGERLYLAWREGECAHIAWTRVAHVITASTELGDGCAIKLETPATVIYDCWTPPAARGQGVYTSVLKTLLATADVADRACWIYCNRDNDASRRGITKAGFKPVYRMRRTRVLGLITSHIVIPESAI